MGSRAPRVRGRGDEGGKLGLEGVEAAVILWEARYGYYSGAVLIGGGLAGIWGMGMGDGGRGGWCWLSRKPFLPLLFLVLFKDRVPKGPSVSDPR